MTGRTEWTDTTGEDRPKNDSAVEEMRWLVGRHPKVAHLVDRVGCFDVEDGVRWVDTEALRALVRGYDARSRAWQDYRDRHYEPHLRDGEGETAFEARLDAWDAAGPQDSAYEPHPGMLRAFGVMSRTEVVRLRLLATVGYERVEFCTGDLDGFDESGWAFVRDWARLILR